MLAHGSRSLLIVTYYVTARARNTAESTQLLCFLVLIAPQVNKFRNANCVMRGGRLLAPIFKLLLGIPALVIRKGWGF